MQDKESEGSTQQGVYQHYRCSFIKFYLFGLYQVHQKKKELEIEEIVSSPGRR